MIMVVMQNNATMSYKTVIQNYTFSRNLIVSIAQLCPTTAVLKYGFRTTGCLENIKQFHYMLITVTATQICLIAHLECDELYW